MTTREITEDIENEIPICGRHNNNRQLCRYVDMFPKDRRPKEQKEEGKEAYGGYIEQQMDNETYSRIDPNSKNAYNDCCMRKWPIWTDAITMILKLCLSCFILVELIGYVTIII